MQTALQFQPLYSCGGFLLCHNAQLYVKQTRSPQYLVVRFLNSHKVNVVSKEPCQLKDPRNIDVVHNLLLTLAPCGYEECECK